jgi:hypothetical protein
MSYRRLIDEAFGHGATLAEETGERDLPAELEQQSLWFAGTFGREFTTVDGRKLRIVQFGEWNRGAGPDFIQAAIELDGVLKRGAIELDPEAADWDHHGHATNPAYREVVLHVVFRRPQQTVFTRDLDHRAVPMLVIAGEALDAALNRPRHATARAMPGRCLRPLAALGGEPIARLLTEAARHRAAWKSGRFLRTADAHGRDAALFQATAETLGYRGNALAMRLLAQRAPMSVLRDDAPAREPILFGTAGFLSPDLHEKAPADTREYLRGQWDTWWKHRGRFETPLAIPWKLHGQRPANHPHRRVGALTALAHHWPTFRRLALARPFQPAPVLDFLATLEHPFWSRRHTLTSAPTARPVALFGRTHGLELLANHLIPLALHEDGLDLPGYLKLRAAAPNDRVKRCALRLFGSLESARPWLKTVAHHQALLQIYHDFCLEDASDCAACPFPEQLAQWG